MDQTTQPERRRRRRLAALLVMALVTGSLSAGALSLAVFQDSQAVSGNAFATGTIDISTDKTTALFGASGMMPGDVATGTILVSNSGTGALRYAITTEVVAGAALAGQLDLDIYAGTACSGTAIFSGKLSNPTPVGSTAQGPNSGDRDLASGDHETLCFRAALPLGTGDAFQDTSTDVTFHFVAEQTVNNP
jgi:spore coat-associated protein N